jgi:hypothetical protein
MKLQDSGIPSDYFGISLGEAKRLIRDNNASHKDCMAATWVICDQADDNPDIFSDLIQCLKRNAGCHGAAAMELYSRSGRPYPENFMDNCHDPEEWGDYLIKAGLLNQGT